MSEYAEAAGYSSGAGTAVAVVEAGRDAWEYAVVSIHARHNDPLQEALNARGRDGWKLLFVYMPVPNEYQCIFARLGGPV